MSRRRGSATALKASEVVAARAMKRTLHSHIGICQAIFPTGLGRAAPEPTNHRIRARMCRGMHFAFRNRSSGFAANSHQVVIYQQDSSSPGRTLPNSTFGAKDAHSVRQKRGPPSDGLLSHILERSSLLRLPELIPPTSLFCGGLAATRGYFFARKARPARLPQERASSALEGTLWNEDPGGELRNRAGGLASSTRATLFRIRINLHNPWPLHDFDPGSSFV